MGKQITQCKNTYTDGRACPYVSCGSETLGVILSKCDVLAMTNNLMIFVTT